MARKHSSGPVLVKKYSNRRLYDTSKSQYITLDELANKIRDGSDVRVIDAKSGEDLTQSTLTQIVIENRGAAKFLPVPLLTQLIRLGDDALAEFFGRYVTGALEVYMSAKRGAQAIAPFNPLATLPFAASDALARMWMSNPLHRNTQPPAPPADDLADLRREIEELKRSMRTVAGSPSPGKDDDEFRDNDGPTKKRARKPRKPRRAQSRSRKSKNS